MKKYIIKKGNHYSNCLNLPIPHFRLNNPFTYNFAIKAINRDQEKVISDDWNKLFGIGSGLSSRSNSIRAAWRYNKEEACYEWCIFREVNRKFTFTQAVRGERCQVVYNPDAYSFYINVDGNITKYVMETDDDKQILADPVLLELQPYFGGNETADADYIIVRTEPVNLINIF